MAIIGFFLNFAHFKTQFFYRTSLSRLENLIFDILHLDEVLLGHVLDGPAGERELDPLHVTAVVVLAVHGAAVVGEPHGNGEGGLCGVAPQQEEVRLRQVLDVPVGGHGRLVGVHIRLLLDQNRWALKIVKNIMPTLSTLSIN